MKVRPLQFFAYALLTIYSVLVALPLVWMVLSSTKTTRELFTAPFVLPADPNGPILQRHGRAVSRITC